MKKARKPSRSGAAIRRRAEKATARVAAEKAPKGAEARSVKMEFALATAGPTPDDYQWLAMLLKKLHQFTGRGQEVVVHLHKNMLPVLQVLGMEMDMNALIVRNQDQRKEWVKDDSRITVEEVPAA